MQVNYDFYENLDPEKVDAIFEQLQEGKRPQPVDCDVRRPARAPSPPKSGCDQPRFGIPNSHKIDVYLQNDGYQALEKALKQMTPEPDHRRSEKIEPCADAAARDFPPE